MSGIPQLHSSCPQCNGMLEETLITVTQYFGDAKVEFENVQALSCPHCRKKIIPLPEIIKAQDNLLTSLGAK